MKLNSRLGGIILIASHLSSMPFTSVIEQQKTEPILLIPENDYLPCGDPKTGRELRRDRRKSNRKSKK